MKAKNILLLVVPPRMGSTNTPNLEFHHLLALTAVLQNSLAGEYKIEAGGNARKVPTSLYGDTKSSSVANEFYLKSDDEPLVARCFDLHLQYVNENSPTLCLGVVIATFKLYNVASDQVCYLDIGAQRNGSNKASLTYFFRETVDQGS